MSFKRIASAGLAAVFLAGVSGAALAGPADDPANWRKVDPENLLVLTIKRQDVIIELRPDMAPKHVEQIKTITKAGHYDGLPFHRVISDFMAQGGEVYAIYQLYPQPYKNIKQEFKFRRDPTTSPVTWITDPDKASSNEQRAGWLDGFIVSGANDAIAAMSADKKVETWAHHCAGAASMARAEDPDTADTQFFLMRQDRSGPDVGMDMAYTVWGRVLQGLDVVRGIKAGKDDENGELSPAQADKMSKAQLAKDIPEYKRPTVYVQRTDGPEFKKIVEGQRANAPDIYRMCSLPGPQVVVEMPPPP